ncbi:MAG: PIN domain-containing protein [Pseudomonadota bacterium]
MAFIIDTNVAIHMRDMTSDVIAKVDALDAAVMMSVVTRVELDGGIHRNPALAAVRRMRVDAILAAIPVLAFDGAAASAYRLIVESTGYSRRKILDRMIAAQAIVQRATLVTMNAADFSDIPGLQLLRW